MHADGCGQRAEYRIGGCLASLDAIQFIMVGRELAQPFGWCGGAFVGDVVRAAGEPVDGFHRSTQPFGQQPGGNREVFVVIDRHRQ